MRKISLITLILLCGCGEIHVTQQEPNSVTTSPAPDDTTNSPQTPQTPAPQPPPNPVPAPAPVSVPQPTPIPPAPLPAPTVGIVTLNWEPPTENTDGTPLTNLSGYDIWYGNSSTPLQRIQISNSTLTTYVIDNLPYGVSYQFYMDAYNNFGEVGPDTGVVSASAQ